MTFRGRPALGAISGLFFGLFVAVDLQQFAVRPVDTLAVLGFPAIGVVLGLALAWWAPFARRKAAEPTPAMAQESGAPDQTRPS